MIEIFHIEGRRSFRVIWYCEEVGLPYRISCEYGKILKSLADVRETFPLMPVVPVVKFDDVQMIESGAVLEVLDSRFFAGRLSVLPESSSYYFYRQWMHFSEATFMSKITDILMVSVATGIPINAFPSGYQSGVDKFDAVKAVGVEQIYSYLDVFLKKNDYFNGEKFGLADIMMHFPVRLTKSALGIDPMNYSSVKSWLQRVESRPAYPKALFAACPQGVHPETIYPADQPLMFKTVKPLSKMQKVLYGSAFKLVSAFRKPPIS